MAWHTLGAPFMPQFHRGMSGLRSAEGKSKIQTHHKFQIAPRQGSKVRENPQHQRRETYQHGAKSGFPAELARWGGEAHDLEHPRDKRAEGPPNGLYTLYCNDYPKIVEFRTVGQPGALTLSSVSNDI